MHSYSQTNLQLYNQLLQSGYTETELAEMRSTYELAMELFAGHFRPNGKPFLSHLVGTASILATLDAPATLVAAGLLHAAYTHGSFPDPRYGITDAKRKKVRQGVGPHVEELVARYTELRWNTENILAIRERIDTLSVNEREVLLVRLANELEDHLDLGMLYGGKEKSAKLDKSVNAVVEIAERVGGADLANKLALVFRETGSAKIPDALRRTERSSFIFTHTPPWLRGYRFFMKAVYSANSVSRTAVTKVVNVLKL